MNRKNITIGIGTLALVAMIIMSTNVSASSGKSDSRKSSPNKIAVKSAIESNNYEAFKAAVAATPKTVNAPEITEAIFAKIVEADKLRKSGDHQGAQEIMVSLGFDKKPFHHKGRGVMFGNLTEDQKIAFKEARVLRQEGKNDEAKKLLIDVGIKKPVRINK